MEASKYCRVCESYSFIFIDHFLFFFTDEDLTSKVLHDNMQMPGDLGKLGDEPVSLPALDMATNRISFRHNDPAYHSINVPNFSSKVGR